MAKDPIEKLRAEHEKEVGRKPHPAAKPETLRSAIKSAKKNADKLAELSVINRLTSVGFTAGQIQALREIFKAA